MLSFQLEKFSSIQDEAASLFKAHWDEIAVDKDKIPLAPDWSKYAGLEQGGMLHCLTVRSEGKLVGYFIAFVLPHPHYSTAGEMAMTDVYFIHPDYRKGSAGIKLICEAERTLRARGVTKAYLSTKVHSDNSKLFQALGWRLTDYSFTKIF